MSDKATITKMIVDLEQAKTRIMFADGMSEDIDDDDLNFDVQSIMDELSSEIRNALEQLKNIAMKVEE